MLKLNNKIAIVTRASRGIRGATAQLLALSGAKVAITYSKSSEAAQQIVTSITDNGGEAIAIQADGTSSEALQNMINAVIQKWNAGIDILINNAGTFATGYLHESGVEIYNQVFELNVRGVYETTRVAVPHINNDGRIINIGSALANYAFPGASAYCATKAAIAGLTRSWAKELAPRKITVNAVMAGSINTALNPDIPENDFAGYQKTLNALGRYGSPDEVAHAVSFLASPNSGFITGSELAIDGGMTA